MVREAALPPFVGFVSFCSMSPPLFRRESESYLVVLSNLESPSFNLSALLPLAVACVAPAIYLAPFAARLR